MKPSPGCSQMPPGLILTKSLAKPRWSGSDGAYSGKIFCCAPISRYRRGLLRQNLICAPISRYRRGLLRQNPYLCPDIPVSTGLITAKFLSAPRYPGIDGAYYGKILICAPISRYRRGLLRQNPYLCPDVQTWRV